VHVNYTTAGGLMTVFAPLGFFIIVMAVLYVLFTRPHMIPGHREIAGAAPVPPPPDRASGAAAASGFPLASGAGSQEPLADRATPPPAGRANGPGEGTDAPDSGTNGSAGSEGNE
jgi:hypothetical protein